MTDITPMPNNAENYYRKAINALENNQFNEAIHYLENSYNLESNPQVFTELVKLYIAFNKQEQLTKLWEQDQFTLDFISQSAELTSLYAQSLPVISPTSESLNKLYQLRDLIQSSTATTELNKAIATISDLLNVKQEINALTTDERVETYAQQLLEKSYFEVLSKLKLIYQTDLDKNLPLLKALLNDDTLLNFIKNDILHYIIINSESVDIDYTWLNVERHIQTDQLKPYTSTQFYLKGTRIIEDYFSQTDPHFAKQVLELFNLHAMVFYPFYNDAISDPQKWLNYTLLQFGLENDMIDILTEQEKEYYQLAQDELAQLFQA